jgi:two-component system, chemotaxis family, chemotaxis protein CheY
LNFRQIDEAPDGEVAWKKILNSKDEERPYAAVFLDINMPNVDGFGVLNKCRQSPDFADLPIVMITSESQKQAVIKAVMEGVSGYVVKPFGVEDIKKKLVELNAKRKKMA